MNNNLFAVRLTEKERKCLQYLAVFMGTDCSSVLRHGLRLYLREYFSTLDISYFLRKLTSDIEFEDLGGDEE